MARTLIVLGDYTSGGGTVVTGSPETDIDGKPVARVGDKATCPRHKCVATIVTGDYSLIFENQPVARHGDRLSCGCTLIAGQQSHVFVDDGGAAARAQAAAAARDSPSAAFQAPSASLRASAAPSSGPQQDEYTLHYHYDDLDKTPVRGVSYRAMLADDTVKTGTLDDEGKANLGRVRVGPVQVLYQHEAGDEDDAEILAARGQVQQALAAIVAQTRQDFAGEWRQWDSAGTFKRQALKLGNQGLGAAQGAWDYASGTVEAVWQLAVLVYRTDAELKEWQRLLLTGDRKGLDQKIAAYRAQGRKVMDAASEMKELFNLLIDDPAIVTLLPQFVEDWWEAIPPDEREHLKSRYGAQIGLDVVVSVVLAAVTIEAGGAAGFGYVAAKAGTTATRVSAKVLELLKKVEEAFKALTQALRKRKRRMREGDRTPDARKEVETKWVSQRMPEKKLPCFSPQKLPAGKYAEMDRQLAGQEQGLNDMTVQEYLDGRKAFQAGGARNPKVAKAARDDYAAQLLERKATELRKQNRALSMKEAARRAKEEVNETMGTLNALHNPDLVAGGRDAIADFGDGEVNFTIGRQWSNARKGELTRVQQLDQAAMQVPEADRSGSKMNGKMERCK